MSCTCGSSPYVWLGVAQTESARRRLLIAYAREFVPLAQGVRDGFVERQLTACRESLGEPVPAEGIAERRSGAPTDLGLERRKLDPGAVGRRLGRAEDQRRLPVVASGGKRCRGAFEPVDRALDQAELLCDGEHLSEVVERFVQASFEQFGLAEVAEYQDRAGPKREPLVDGERLGAERAATRVLAVSQQLVADVVESHREPARVVERPVDLGALLVQLEAAPPIAEIARRDAEADQGPGAAAPVADRSVGGEALVRVGERRVVVAETLRQPGAAGQRLRAERLGCTSAAPERCLDRRESLSQVVANRPVIGKSTDEPELELDLAGLVAPRQRRAEVVELL